MIVIQCCTVVFRWNFSIPLVGHKLFPYQLILKCQVFLAQICSLGRTKILPLRILENCIYIYYVFIGKSFLPHQCSIMDHSNLNTTLVGKTLNEPEPWSSLNDGHIYHSLTCWHLKEQLYSSLKSDHMTFLSCSYKTGFGVEKTLGKYWSELKFHLPIFLSIVNM